MGSAGPQNGPEALFSNPAFLHNTDAGHSFVLHLPGGSAELGGGLFNVPVYNRYLTQNRVLTAEMQRKMLDQWFPDGRNSRETAGFEAGLTGGGLSYTAGRHSFGLAHMLRFTGHANTRRGVLEAGLGGLNQDFFAEPTPLDGSFSAALFTQISAGYSIRLLQETRSFVFGRPLEIYAGAAPSLLLGHQGLKADLRSRLQIEGDSLLRHQFSYELHTHGRFSRQLQEFAAAKEGSGARENPDLSTFIDRPFANRSEVAGYGFGLNLGLHANVGLSPDFLKAAFFGSGPREIHLSLALSDLGHARFSSDAARFTHSDVLEWRGVNLDERWINQEFEGNADDYIDYVLQDSLGSDTYLSYESSPHAQTRIALPTRLHLATQLRAGRAAAGLAFTKGFNSSGLNSKRLAVATNMEYSTLHWLILRSGLRAGGSQPGRFDSGLGIRTRRFEIDSSLSTTFNPENGGSWYGFSLASRLKF
ncbi:MAG: DUF5723 family protein [Cyclonatronaceae bacterium]